MSEQKGRTPIDSRRSYSKLVLPRRKNDGDLFAKRCFQGILEYPLLNHRFIYCLELLELV